MLKGVYEDKKKDGSLNYRASITVNTKHISLGSYETPEAAGAAYAFSKLILSDNTYLPSNYPSDSSLLFEKYVSLCNLRDSGLYFSNPIIIRKRDFSYFLSPDEELIFDSDDLFYFSSHKIQKRGKHLFVSEYGMQTSVRERFGIKSFSVEGRDFLFVNGNSNDYRRENIKIINKYMGVTCKTDKHKNKYKTVIHVRSNYVVGLYSSEKEAAIAYNKAADILKKNGFTKKFFENYVDDISPREYAEIYSKLSVSETIRNLKPHLSE